MSGGGGVVLRALRATGLSEGMQIALGTGLVCALGTALTLTREPTPQYAVKVSMPVASVPCTSVARISPLRLSGTGSGTGYDTMKEKREDKRKKAEAAEAEAARQRLAAEMGQAKA